MRRLCHGVMNPCQYIHGWSGVFVHVRAYAIRPYIITIYSLGYVD